VDWSAVTARALAFLCVRQAQVEGETLVEQATFLERFGIPRSEAATILGTTSKSLAEMERQQRARKKSAPKKSTGQRAKASKGTARGGKAR
jgi:ectoine hydroxylase-related dioxygenase (phytanoyl-CoA dioxygenase family)